MPSRIEFVASCAILKVRSVSNRHVWPGVNHMAFRALLLVSSCSIPLSRWDSMLLDRPPAGLKSDVIPNVERIASMPVGTFASLGIGEVKLSRTEFPTLKSGRDTVSKDSFQKR